MRPTPGRLFAIQSAVLLCAAIVVQRAEAGEADWNDLMRDGGVIVDHQPYNFGGGASDTLYREHEFLPPTWQSLADDFTLVDPAAIRRIKFWGFYDHNVEPQGVETFRIRFYESRMSENLPGALIYESSSSGVQRAFTGRTILVSGAPAEWEFCLDLGLPFVAEANLRYWLEIVQVGSLESMFRWEFSRWAEINGQAFDNPIVGEWTHTSVETSDTAFQLITVPESTTILFMLPFLATLLIRHKR